uniref:Uncharacterized protein n=1 Tax=Rhizophora mucronata TaxID=61149 RepID=A0A2P2LZX4_RHIMU
MSRDSVCHLIMPCQYRNITDSLHYLQKGSQRLENFKLLYRTKHAWCPYNDKLAEKMH